MQVDHSQNDQPNIELILELGLALQRLINLNESLYQDVYQGISMSLENLLAVLGVPAKPLVEIRAFADTTDQQGTFLRLTVGGQLCRYPNELLQRVYSYIVGLHSGLLATKEQILAWLHRDNKQQQFASDVNLVEFLQLVCLEIIKLQPSVLLGEAQTEAYLSELANQVDESAIPVTELDLDEVTLRRMLSTVLNLRISISDTKTVSLVLREECAKGLSPEAITEHLITALSLNCVEIQLSREYLRQLTLPDSESDRGVFTLMRDGLFYEHGLRFPDFRFTVTDTLKPNSFTFKINHLTALPQLGLVSDKMLVNDTVERLRLLNITGIVAKNPALGYECSLIDVEFQDKAETAGLTTWNQLGFLVLCFSAELTRYGACFVHRQEVDRSLGQLAQSFPVLVEGVKEKFSLEQITQVLRSLIDEELSMRNLRLILEQILNYDTIIVDSPRYIVFDDRLPLPGEPHEVWGEMTRNLTSYARIGLRTYLSYKYTKGQNTLIAYLLDPEIEKLVSNHQQKGTYLPKHQQDQILEAVHIEVDTLPVINSIPVILTTIVDPFQEDLKLGFSS